MMKIYEEMLEEHTENNKSVAIPRLSRDLKNGEISVEDCEIEVNKMKNRVTQLFDTTDSLTELVTKQERKIEEQSIKTDIETKEMCCAFNDNI